MGKIEFMSKEKGKTILEKINELAQKPAKVSIDEVAHAYISTIRVEGWRSLCKEFGGYKIGAIYAFVLELLEKHIADSTSVREMAKEALFQQFEEAEGRK